jgi:predicted MFS family arabinose efflux permease
MAGMNLLIIATIGSLFSDTYNFSRGAVGLAFLAPGIGGLLAALFGGKISSKIYSTVSVLVQGIFSCTLTPHK